MNAVPAKVAGVRELVMASPNPNPLVLAAAALAGVDRVLGIGGAQAIAALAYGTEVDPARRQDRRPGQRLCRRGQAPGVRRGRHRHGRRPVRDPGDRRRQRAGRLGGDGPVLAGRARRVGAGDPAFAGRRRTWMRWTAPSASCSPEMPRRKVIAASLKARGALILTRDLEEACAVANRIAPEHLELVGRESRSLAAEADATPARSSSAAGARRRSATTAPGRTTCCRPRARRASLRRSASTTSRSAPA